MIEINLIPDVKRELLKAKSIRAKVIFGSILVAVTSVVIVISLVTYVYAFQTLRDKDADERIETERGRLIEVDDLSEMLTIQNQLSIISSLNDGKKINSRIFDVLSAMIPPAPNDIHVTNLVIDSEAGSIVIDGYAPNSYAAAEVFRKTIGGAKVKFTDKNKTKHEVNLASSVSANNVSYAQDTSGEMVLSFSLGFIYAPELFDPASKDLTIYISNTGNATDSYLGIPKSIFEQPVTVLKENQ